MQQKLQLWTNSIIYSGRGVISPAVANHETFSFTDHRAGNVVVCLHRK